MFYTYLFKHNLNVQGVTSIFLLEERYLQVSRNSMWTFCLKNNEIEDCWTHTLKNDTSNGDMDEKVDHWFDSFEKLHKEYNIMPSLSLNYLLIEEIYFCNSSITPRFINRENETKCSLNATFQLIYLNVLFRQLVLNINCYTVLNGLKKFNIFFIISKISWIWRSYRNFLVRYI